MKLIKPDYKILTEIDGEKILKNIEKAGRTAYKSEDKITETSAKKFVGMIIRRKHLSVIEHEGFSIKFIIDRGVSHELVRHRLSSFTQESSRYCNYSKGKFNGELTFIDLRPYLTEIQSKFWLSAINFAEIAYNNLIKNGSTPQFARSVLPNSLKTEIIVTANLREWRTIFEQRTDKAAHPQIREVMVPLLEEIKTIIPVIFDDINQDSNKKTNLLKKQEGWLIANTSLEIEKIVDFSDEFKKIIL